MSTPGFRSFSPALQRFFIATVVNMIGSAALFGFSLIYFHEVRGIPLGQAGLAQGSMNFAVVGLTPVAGSLSDRFGARRILTAGCLVSIVAASMYHFVDSFATALAASLLLGVGNALWFPSQSALLALIVTPEQRPAVSAFQRAALNIGAALGGVLGGLMLTSETVGAFQRLFLLNVITYLVFLAVLPSMPSGRVTREATAAPSFTTVLADRFFVSLLITDVAIALGFGFLWAFMPTYASALGISNGVIGILFTFGALSVAVTQLPTLRWVRGRSRMGSLTIMNLWFAAAFVLMLTTPHISLVLAGVVIASAQVLGGFGESLLGAVRQPLTSDLAPRELVGRYYGLATMVFQGGMGFAVAIGGLLMERSLSGLWLAALAISISGAAGSWLLRRRIPAALRLSA